MGLVLGINTTHDAAAALVDDGRIVMAVEEERLSRVKHHFGQPLRAVQLCLDAGGLDMSTLPHVAYAMNTSLWLRFFGWYFVRNLPASAQHLGRKPSLWKSHFRAERQFREATGFGGRFHTVDHHAAHADSAFWPSGFEEAAFLTIDGAGEKATTVLGRVDDQRQSRYLSLNYPISIGKVWEAVTNWLGGRATQDEGKVMGLAPYGDTRFLKLFERVFAPSDDVGFHQDMSYFTYHLGAPLYVSEKFIQAFGPPKGPGEEMQDHHRAVARALQHQTERVVVELARGLRERSGLSKLVMAGGVALNCVANGRLLEEGLFDDIFVQPAAGDNGACLGAALFVNHRKLGAPRGPAMTHAFQGPRYDEKATLAAARERQLEPERPDDIVAETARRLADGQVVGWMQGRMEYGPRALGNRSILADPTRADSKDRVNARVKFREAYRPFAPSVPLEDAADWFEGARPSPYMLLAFPVRPACRARLPAVTHVDGTARLQTVTPEQNERYHRLLKEFGALTGVPVLLNTSFNVRGEPVVCTPGEALDALQRTDLDAVVVGDLLFARNRTTAPA